MEKKNVSVLTGMAMSENKLGGKKEEEEEEHQWEERLKVQVNKFAGNCWGVAFSKSPQLQLYKF